MERQRRHLLKINWIETCAVSGRFGTGFTSYIIIVCLLETNNKSQGDYPEGRFSRMLFRKTSKGLTKTFLVSILEFARKEGDVDGIHLQATVFGIAL